MNGYANLIAARLRRLADEKSTGMLPMSGRGDGAIFFRDGQIVHAESTRTSPPGDVPGPGGESSRGGAVAAALRPAGLGGMLKLTESVIDATTDLLSSESRYAKFRPAGALADGHGRPIAVETLLAEVQRRHEVLRQLAPAVSPDTPVACEPSLGLPSAQVSPVQWALLRRAGDETTPRALAVHLSRSVFGTTLEVYRLVELGLLVVHGQPPAPADGQAVDLSFIRALAGRKGSDG